MSESYGYTTIIVEAQAMPRIGVSLYGAKDAQVRHCRDGNGGPGHVAISQHAAHVNFCLTRGPITTEDRNHARRLAEIFAAWAASVDACYAAQTAPDESDQAA